LSVRSMYHRTPKACLGVAQVVQSVDGVLYDFWGANQQVPNGDRFRYGWNGLWGIGDFPTGRLP